MDFLEDFFEARAGGEAVGDEVLAGDEGWGDDGFGGEFRIFLFEVLVVVGKAVGGCAIDAVEFHFEGEGGSGHEAFEFGGAHLLDVHELHVAGDHVGGGVDDGVGVFEAGKDFMGHFRAEGVVAVEAESSVWVDGLGGRFGDVVKEGGEAEFERCVGCEHVEHDTGVDVNVAFGVPFGWLFAADEGDDFGEEVVDDRGIDKEFEAAAAVGVGDDFGEFVADAFGRDFQEEVGVGSEGGEGLGFDGEVEGGGETDGAEEAEGVFFEAGVGVADGAEGAGVEVCEALDVVDDFAGGGVLEEAVDGEVAALGVFFWGGVGDSVGSASVLV